MLVFSVSLLIITRFPVIASSARARIIIGIVSTVFLGGGLLVLEGPLPLYGSVICIHAVLPGHNITLIAIAVLLSVLHIARDSTKEISDTSTPLYAQVIECEQIIPFRDL